MNDIPTNTQEHTLNKDPVTTSASAFDAADGGEIMPEGLECIVTKENSFGIRLIDTPEGRSKASLLINKMYSWRGYAGTHRLSDDANRVTLTANDHGKIVGTLTLGLDSPIGLLADELFKEEIDARRGPDSKVCEMTKLAFDSGPNSKAGLASLFHICIIHARDVHKCTDLFIEVNPRHSRFYERMMGFKRIGDVKMNPRVNAPAHLLWVKLAYMTEQIQKHGGKGANAGDERSFYPLFFSPHEEIGIINRLLNMPS
ncbi:N-acyl amino acid synthase FeeM domain-containing protein [Janthinobacterium sp.]|uniref:N-acyl amino acid synthase FeeM domain-containing protein n=1 Tax=Janthinobacterium sp. TaxID=1871054 RepID=UPI00293D91C8|nr:N-acetyltransferase [Janthinobacterium sp.]